MSEQQVEQTSGEPGSLSAGPAVPNSSDAQSRLLAALVQDAARKTPDTASPGLQPEQGASAEVDASKADAATPEASEIEAPKVEPSKAEVPYARGKIMIMSADDRNWANDEGAGPEVESEPGQGMFGKRRLAAMAAVAVLAVVALGGVLANTSLSHRVGDQTASPANNSALEASVARMEADILALKTSVEHISKMGMSQYNKTSDRLDKIEKAQAEPAAKLARLSESVDKLRAAAQVAGGPAAAPPAAAKEVTGSISPPPVAPRVEAARLPKVEGWVLHEVANGAALIEGRRGIYEVSAGDPVPGLGRVDAIRRQDGRWVVVTSKGLVVAR